MAPGDGMARTQSSNFTARTLLAAMLLAALAASGCSSLRGVPARYQPTAAIVESIRLTPADLAELQAATDEAERNRLQNKAVAVIDLNYHQFVRELVGDRQDMSAAAAGVALGAATAGAFVDSVAAKTNYALLAATAIGAFGIVDRNYYYEKTVPALVAAMGAARANMLLRIRTSQRDPIDVYNGVAALADLEDYFTAGSILAAISEITTRADGDKQAALDQVRVLEVPTDADIALRRGLSRAILAIDEQTLPKGKAALATLKQAETRTVKETRLALLRMMRPPTTERLKAVQDALTSAGLMP
jgi:hypothetical protein